nr:hypothetical protein [Pseudomonas asplenii]
MSMAIVNKKLVVIFACSAAVFIGGKLASHINAQFIIKNSAASSLASTMACFMMWGDCLATFSSRSTLAPSSSRNFAGSCSMSSTVLMPSHTPLMASNPPSKIPLPTAMTVPESERLDHC